MRRQHLTQLIGTFVVAAALVALPTAAFAGIATSAHNLAAGVGGGEICVPCHTPHTANSVTAAPLWNHAVSGETFEPYANPAGTLDATDVTVPSGVSLLCLSCHDGVTGVDAFGATPGSTAMTGINVVGTDLKNDHPISFLYQGSIDNGDTGLFATTATAGPLAGDIATELLFGGSVECSSCHDVHNEDISTTKLLRISIADSELCLTCHNK